MATCPFCGSADQFSERSDLSSSYITCNNCLARGPVCCQESDDEDEPGSEAAWRAWNERNIANPRHPRSTPTLAPQGDPMAKGGV